MSAAIVSLHHEQPMTTSLAIAACTENEHGSILLSIRKYADDLREFGELAFHIADAGISRFEIANKTFEIANSRGKQGRPTEFTFLNEQQATLLISFLRNSPIVIEFKVALVRAFFELRDQAQTNLAQQRTPMNMNHRADILVATDRTFGAWLRLGRRLRLGHGRSVILANEKTLADTGIDVMAEAGYQPTVEAVAELSSAVRFTMAWLSGELDMPVICCAGADLYKAYCDWCRQQAEPWPLSHNLFSRDIKPMPGLWNGVKAIRKDDEMMTIRVVLPDSDLPEHGTPMCNWLARRVPEFKEALESRHG